MNESQKPPEVKRSWFRFHLATALLIMLIGGGLLGANLTNRMPSPHGGEDDQARIELVLLELEGIRKQFGWPLIANEIYHPQYFGGILSANKRIKRPDEMSIWNENAVLIDSSVAVGILLSVAFVSEFLIRRREACKNER